MLEAFTLIMLVIIAVFGGIAAWGTMRRERRHQQELEEAERASTPFWSWPEGADIKMEADPGLVLGSGNQQAWGALSGVLLSGAGINTKILKWPSSVHDIVDDPKNLEPAWLENDDQYLSVVGLQTWTASENEQVNWRIQTAVSIMSKPQFSSRRLSR